MLVIAIVPSLPPSINGVGDYAFNLALQLRQEFGIETQFIVCDPNWEKVSGLGSFSIQHIGQRSAANLLSILNHQNISTVILHYVGYGYAKRGYPAWLGEGLKTWKKQHQKARLITMFHEVYASGPPWTSAFWLTSLQRSLATQLSRMSNSLFTSKQAYAEIIQSLTPNSSSKLSLLPIFSSIGEPQTIPLLKDRSRRLVVFGHKNSRLRVYNEYLPQLKQVCQQLQIQEIYDIGVPTNLELSELIDVPVIEKGITAAPDVSNILLNSLASLVGFPPPDYLAKSSIYASYCSHGVFSILPVGIVKPVDGLVAGKHYWALDCQTEPITLDRAQEIATHAYTWYQSHSLPEQARIYATHLTAIPS
uniref:Glycosyltransferase subfamily 4-like N-terminal domain-containing protein n=1 Tax=Cyanothece sp. (strain PCC 7425 / ATCC 29141) TaxID=395961 RepID=B8HNC5_CYAP4